MRVRVFEMSGYSLSRRHVISSLLQLAVFYPLGIFGNDEAVDTVLYIAVHKSGEVVNRIIDTMVGDAPLREIVGADFGRPVARRDLSR